MKEGKLFFKAKAKSGELEVVCDKKEQFRIMKCIHSGIGVSKKLRALGGHLGMNTLQTEVASRYYWPCVTQDVKKFIKSCKECQCSKLSNLEKTKQTLHPVKVPQGIWQQIGIDLVGPLPQSPEGHEYMLTVIDYFSKWVELFALKDKKATSVAQCLFQLMCCFGPAKIHISDQGREFCNELHQQMYLLTGVHHRITGHYHPQANGLCERMNGATMAALKKTVEEEAEDWYRLLDAVAYSYRATKCRATGLSPFEVLFGRKMGLPINFINNPEEEEEDLTLEQAMELEKQLKNAQEEVSQPEVLEAAKVVLKEIFDSVSKNIHKE